MAESHGHSPLEQFTINPLLNLNVAGYNIDITNSSLLMIISAVFAIIFFLGATRQKKIIPSRMQIAAESLYNFTESMLISNTGEGGRKFFPLVFSLFIFVLLSNLFGMIPYSFTSTSHIVVTFALAAMLFVIIVIASFMKHGLKFFSIFLPSGAPGWLAPLLIVIELFAYLIRPFSLSIRLAANMTAGHTMLKVIASFVISLGILGGWFPLLFLMILTGFEIFVAILQAYIFTMLACVYLNDAVHLAH
ncbi:MAG: F0F1 ATP synthase subunit A [Rickettsiales bacterium]|jgi:F-type H+-transporting ATPase subunit a|nr:F0F1 ATP synthase subunit A [Rickettsiales bacterium]